MGAEQRDADVDVNEQDSAVGSPDDVMAILAGVEQQFERLRSVRASHAEEVRTLTERAADMDRRDAALEARRHELDAQRQALDEAAAEADAARAALAEQREALDRANDELEAQRTRLAEGHALREAELDEATAALSDRASQLAEREARLGDHERRLAEADAQIGGLREQLAERQHALEAARADMAEQAEQLAALRDELARIGAQAEAGEVAAMELLAETEAQRDEHARRADAAAHELAERTQAIDRLAATLEQREQDVEALTAQLDDANDKLGIAFGKLSEFAQVLDAQVPHIEQGAAAALELDEQRRLAEALSRRLRESGDDGALADKEQRIAELSASIAALEDRLAEREAERAEREEAFEAELSRVRAERPTAALDEARADEAREEEAATAQRLAACQAQLARVQEELGTEHAAREQMLADMHRERSALQAEIGRCRAELDAALTARDDALDERVADDAPGRSPGVEHLERRRHRLHRLRHRLREQREMQERAARAPSAPVIDGPDHTALRTQQRHLEEVQKLLIASEQQMVRKWSRNRSFIAAFAVMLMLILNGAAAWHTGAILFPPEPAATITLVSDEGDLTPLRQRQWQRWHTELVMDESVRNAVAERMKERLLVGLTDPAAVQELLVNELGVDSSPAGLTLTLKRQDAELSRSALEVIATTLINESRRRAVDREDIPAIEAPGLAALGREAIDVMTPEDQRLSHALPIFGGLCMVAMAMFGIAYSQMSRSPRVLDEYVELFSTSAKADPDEFDELEASLKPLPPMA